ncbi:MAG: acyl-CoA dehydrogenase family protein [Dehalococcoidia bacterium]
MTTAILERPTTTPSLAGIVGEAGPTLAAHAAEHDREGTFVTESYAALKSAGFFAAAVPSELGGLGAGLKELAFAHHDLAAFCGSTSLASAMHTHTVATLAWRFRRGAPVEKTLRRVAEEGLVLISTGGSDHVRPSAVARRVDGGYSVSGRKIFASQSPVGSMLATSAVSEGDAREILALSIPMNAPGLQVLDTWDAHGMRGTGSHDIQLNDVFVGDAQVGAHRPYDRLDPLIRIALINGLTIITGVYLGLVRAALDAVTQPPDLRARASDPVLQRLVGQVEYEYSAARMAFDGALARLGDDPESTFEHFLTVQHAKRAVAEHGARAIEAAMAARGGQSFSRSSPLDRIARDFRGINYHPLTPEATLFYAGRVASAETPNRSDFPMLAPTRSPNHVGGRWCRNGPQSPEKCHADRPPTDPPGRNPGRLPLPQTHGPARTPAGAAGGGVCPHLPAARLGQGVGRAARPPARPADWTRSRCRRSR